MKRLSHYLLVLLLALSTVTLTAHGVAHADTGFEQCMLCASHAGANPAAVGETPSLPGMVAHRLPPESSVALPRSVHRAALPQPRAPPPSS